MAVTSQVSPEEYLATSYEPDAEYVRGEVIERNAGDNFHSDTQTKFVIIFGNLRADVPVFPKVELRLRLAADEYRIPDVCLYTGANPTERVPSLPPFIAVEVVSPDDALSSVTEKLDRYWRWGVPHVWAADPNMRKCYIYDAAGLHEVKMFAVLEISLEVRPEQIF